ncbi:NAD(P)-dependent oxidoreductase [Diplocloster agilis]|uniref:NAD(P)-dependent oxidoreductase n=1 Tax=Diplocloster agilis TaxID=2850323 RepID=UPI002ED584F8
MKQKEDYMKLKIGFIGLGHMGLPMALNLCKAGYPVYVHSTSRQSSSCILEAGGNEIASFAEMARTLDVIITIVPADREIMDLYLGEDGILEHAHEGLICIDMTSAMGETKRKVLQHISRCGRQIGFADAPVSGGVTGAQNGTLTIMAGCQSELLEAIRPVLAAMGKKIVYCGDVGSGSDIKMINQMLNAANTAIAAETVCLAKRLGLDLQTLCDVVNDSSGGSYIFKNNVPKYFLTGDHTPGFRLDLMKKDIGLYRETAEREQAFSPLSAMVYELYKAVSNQGGGERNYTYIVKWMEENQRSE